MKHLWKFALILSFAFVLASCDEDEDPATVERDDEQEQALVDEGYVNAEISYASNMSLEGSTNAEDEGGRLSEGGITYCANLSADPDTKTIVLDFGSEGCTTNGKTRKGKITVVYAGYTVLGTNKNFAGNHTITFDNYSVNGNTIDGTVSVTNYSLDLATLSLTYSRATDVDVEFSDGDAFAYTGAHSITYKTNSTLSDLTDDTLELTGGSAGTTRENISYTSTIAEKLAYTGSCVLEGVLYPSSGHQDLTIEDVDYSIHWGSGTCDKTVSISLGNLTFEKELP